jgi:hypothetical protein
LLRDGKGVVVCAKAEEKDAVDATVTMLFVVVVVVVVRFIVVIFETEVVVALLAAMEKRVLISLIFFVRFFMNTIAMKKKGRDLSKTIHTIHSSFHKGVLFLRKEECIVA